MNDLLDEFLQARAARDQAQEHLDMVQARMIKQMEADQRKSYKITDGNWVKTVTYVAKRTTVIDEKGLRKALTAKVYDKYTVRKLDRTAMEKAMDSGEIDPITVSRFVELVPGRPYLELRVKEAPDAQALP